MTPALATTYLGLQLRTPLVASAGPLTGHLDTLSALQDAGVAAVVLPSLFEEEVEQESLELHDRLETGAGAFTEAPDFFPEMDFYDVGPDRHVRLVGEAKRRLSVPVVASLNASSPGSWVRYARMLEDAGADAIELNVYDVAADPTQPGSVVEERVLSVVAQVRAATTLPLGVKLGPSFSALAAFAAQVVRAGADGLVLFNRFYQPDIDLETLSVRPRIELSDSKDLRLPLRWVGILRPQLPGTSLAASSGVHTASDVVKVLLAGADVAMMTSALLRGGPGHVTEVEAGLRRWLDEHEYASVAQLRGSVAQHTAADPRGYERGQYIRSLSSYRWTGDPGAR